MPLIQAEIMGGVLYFKTAPNQEDQNDMRLDLLQAYCTLPMHGCHDDIGHLGTKHMLDFLCDWFYWFMMQDDIEQHT